MAKPDTNNAGGSPPGGNLQILPLVLWADLIEDARLAQQRTRAVVARSKTIKRTTAALITESRAARHACQESRMKAGG
jgi:hypothetical protein